MGMTMTEKILAAHAGLPCVKAGDLIEAKLDLVLGNDITTPVAITTFEAAGLTKIFDQDKIAIVLDHYTPCKDIKSAELCAQARAFAKKHGITHLYDVGEAGIEHALLPEKGLVAPGDCVIGADSHTCTYGALGAFSTGVGSTDMAAGMAIGENWFKVPAAIKVTLTGKLRPYVSGKDVILHLIGKIGVDGALYQSLEFTGEGVASLSMDDRFTIANMAIEAGAKNGIFPVDEKTVEYVSGRVNRPYTVYEADADARYAREVVIDLSSLAPTVSLPHLPSNTKTISEAKGLPIQQAVIGSCTNGRISDLRQAAEILSDYARHAISSGEPRVMPQISSACPTILRLIRTRFPKLIPNVASTITPVELAAILARREAEAETGLPPEEIGVFSIVPAAIQLGSF